MMTFFKSTKVHEGGLKNHELLYYILETGIEIDEYHNAVVYGIQVDKTEFTTSEISESKLIKDITTSKDNIMGLAQKLYNGIVTPTSLPEIIDDYISAY